MRSSDLKHLAALEADEIAGDAFDRQTPGVQQWIADAIRGEWSTDAFDAAMYVIDRAVDLYHRPTDAERVARLRRAVASLREEYVDHARRHGTYEGEAVDNVVAAAEEAAEARAEMWAEQRAFEAAEAAKRG